MSQIKNIVMVITILFLIALMGNAQTTPSSTPQRGSFLKRSATLGINTIIYRVYTPAGYDSTKKYPVILYLHGSGGTGNDNEKQTGGKTGTYAYKSGGAVNEISIQELVGNKLRVELYASYEYEVNGNLNANVGEAKGIAALNGDTAVLLPKETEGCEIALKFSANKIIVKPKNEFKNCGFGLNVSAQGTYTKVNNKPDFNDSDEATASTDNATASEQNSKIERIRFAPGKSSTVVKGRITGKKEIVYIVGARAGQTMTVKITKGARTDDSENNDAVFHIEAPDGSYPMGMAGEMAEFDTGWSGKLKKSGDYKIVVGTIESEKVNFKMSVSIR